MNRRQFKKTLLGLVLLPLYACDDSNKSKTEYLSREQLKQALNKGAFYGVEVVGKLSSGAQRQENILSLIEEKYPVLLKSESSDHLALQVKSAIKNDFINDDTVKIKGFVFSQLEYLIFSLRAQ